MLLDLADDYAKKNLLCFATMPAMFEDDTRDTLDRAMLNVLLSFEKYVDAGCQVIPLSLKDSYGLRGQMVEFPCIEYKVRSYFTHFRLSMMNVVLAMYQILIVILRQCYFVQ